jgi:hypothetical protein
VWTSADRQRWLAPQLVNEEITEGRRMTVLLDQATNLAIDERISNIWQFPLLRTERSRQIAVPV